MYGIVHWEPLYWCLKLWLGQVEACLVTAAQTTQAVKAIEAL